MAFKYFYDQNYEEIKALCLKSNKLFVDETFPPDKTSISTKTNAGKQFEWKRPRDIISNPQFIVGTIQPTDLDQGQIGNCWLISALSALANNQELVKLVVPDNQSYDQNYAGIFRFRFWHYGEWVEVVVDDHLPTKNNRLTFCRNLKDQNEMFGCLLEKAYAKLNKCYFNLISGEIMDALIDLTGGVHESFKIKGSLKQPKMDQNKLWNTILNSFEMKSMIGCAIEGKGQEEKGPYNLVTGHAYTILDAYEILHENFTNFQLRASSSEDVKNKNSIKLLKIRNPWGSDSSYSGKWSLNSNEWNQISDSIKAKLGVNQQTDGQFFIAYEDFITFFDDIDMVHVNLNAFYGPSNQIYSSIKWISNAFYGAWVPGVNSGGCLNHGQESYWKNPQYVIELKLRNNIDQNVSVIISLMQTETLKLREQTGSYSGSREALGFYIYKIKDEKAVTDKSKPIDPDNLNFADSSGTYIYQREISKRCDLLPGSYVIVPSCFKKDVAMKFLLRIFIEGELENVQKSLKSFDLNTNIKETIQVNKNTKKLDEKRGDQKQDKIKNVKKQQDDEKNPSTKNLNEKKKQEEQKKQLKKNDETDDINNKENSNNKNQKEDQNLNLRKNSDPNSDTENSINDTLEIYHEQSDEAFTKYINSLKESRKMNQTKIEMVNDDNFDNRNNDTVIGGRVTSTACLLM